MFGVMNSSSKTATFTSHFNSFKHYKSLWRWLYSYECFMDSFSFFRASTSLLALTLVKQVLGIFTLNFFLFLLSSSQSLFPLTKVKTGWCNKKLLSYKQCWGRNTAYKGLPWNSTHPSGLVFLRKCQKWLLELKISCKWAQRLHFKQFY